MKKNAFKEFVISALTENVPLKLLAVLAALIIWIIFINTQDPLATETYKIPLTVVNLEKYEASSRYIELKDGESLENISLSVTVRGRMSVLQTLATKKISDVITVYVDVYELEGDHLNIHYTIAEEYAGDLEFTALYNTQYLDVFTEAIISKELPVQLEVTGTVAEGYLLENDKTLYKQSAETVTVTGPESEIEKFSYALISVSVEGVKETVAQSFSPVFIGEEDQILLSESGYFEQSVAEVYVEIPVYRLKTLDINASVEGIAPSGWEYLEDLAISKNSVTVYGPQSMLENVTAVSLPAVNLLQVKGAYRNTVKLQDILDDLFDGEVGVYGTDDSVTVTLSTEEISTVTVELTEEGCSQKSYDKDKWETAYTIDKKITSTVTLKGRKSLLSNLEKNLVYSVDLSKLAETTSPQIFTVTFSLPQGVTQVSEAKFTVTLTPKEEQKQ